MHGPFVHGINKGGLNDIIRFQRLVSTEARGIAGGGTGVRAYEGDFQTLFRRMNSGNSPSGKQFVEFHTFHPPRSRTPPGLANWPLAEGEYLNVRISGVFEDNGRKVR